MDVPSVLIVDDDRGFRHALQLALTARGYAVSEAANGREALARLANVDLVVLDWQMPVMGGGETCAAVRAASGARVVVLAGGDHGKEALASGASAFLRKPLDAGVLFACLEALIGPGTAPAV